MMLLNAPQIVPVVSFLIPVPLHRPMIPITNLNLKKSSQRSQLQSFSSG